MPHVIVKLWPGRSEQQKSALAEQITRDLMTTLGSTEKSVSVAIEEVRPEDWTAQVWEPDIAPRLDRLYKKPGYTPG